MTLSSTPAPSRIVLTARGLALVLVFGVLFGVPTHAQLLGRPGEQTWFWRLYRLYGRDTCAVTWHEVTSDGQLETINRPQLLQGSDSHFELPDQIRTVKRKRLLRHTRYLCDTLERERETRVEVRVTGACAGTETWIRIDEEVVDACRREGRAFIRQALKDGLAEDEKRRWPGEPF